jgi:hypothetical protein
VHPHAGVGGERRPEIAHVHGRLSGASPREASRSITFFSNYIESLKQLPKNTLLATPWKKLTPEQRSNICRIIGRFAHLAKRRVQVDNYFATQTIELAYACENYLPEDIMEQVKEYERAEKLNPPQEKRTKSIPVDELQKETGKVQREAEGRGVLIDSGKVSETIDGVPLYKK